MSLFDAAIYLFALFAIVTGFNAGLLRSLAAILAYALATPAAIALAPRANAMLVERNLIPPGNDSYVLVGVLLIGGMVIGWLLRFIVNELGGERIGFIDRMLGALLGVARVGLLAVLVVLIFARIIPPGLEPSWLTASKLRPTLLAAGEAGLRKLPPGVEDQIERLKRERGL